MAEDYKRTLALVGPHTLVGEDRMRVLYDTARHCAALGQCMVEVGVYQGGTARMIRAAAPDAALILCDTFAGHPASAVSRADESAHFDGRFADTNTQRVLNLFEGVLPPALVIGPFEETWRECGGARPGLISFVHCDVDRYSSTRAVLDALFPLLVSGGAILVDDYGFDDCPGARAAVDEYEAEHADIVRVERLETKQARLWRRVRTR